MRIGVLGTGSVGRAIASRLVELGHEVTLGSRSAHNETAVEWVAAQPERAHAGTFADAAGFGELVFNCTRGDASLTALELAGAEALGTKVLVDVANPLDFSKGMPPSLTVKDTDSLSEQIQRAFPNVRVVKSLNTMNSDIMVHPQELGSAHVVFMSGNDAEAKVQVRGLLREFGWADDSILDLGDISTARGVEMFLPLWLRIYGARGNGKFNIGIVG